MKRKIFTAMLTLALTAGICGSVYAADSYISLQIGSKTMTVGGEERTLDAVPVIIDNRTFVPVRAVVEALGGTAGWDAETKTVLLDKNDIHIELTIGSKTALLNKGEEEMDTAPVIIDGRTMLPLRFIAENFGFETAWDAETKTIGISQTNEIYESDEINYNYDIVHYGSDGNLYISADNSFKVLDENGGLIDEYEDMDKMSFRLTDEDGKAYVFYYDADEAYITAPDGTKTTLADNDDFELADKDGNTYSFVFARPDNKICSCLIVKDKNGDIIKRYYDKGEMRSYYKDKNGRDVIGIVSKDGGPDNGIILADGKYVQFSREYTSTYVDDNDNFYGEINGWFCPLKKAGGASDEAQMTDFYDIYTDKHGNEYKCINIDESPVIIYPDGKKAVLTQDRVETEDSGDMPPAEDADIDYIQDYIITVYYNGSDGRTYSQSMSSDYKVEEKNGKTYELKYTGFVYEYTNKDGGIYKYRYNDSTGKYKLTKPDGKTVGLVETYG